MSYEEMIAGIVSEVVRREVEPLRAEIRRLARPDLLSVEQAAEVAGVSAATIRRRIRAREIPVTRVGRQIRIDAQTLRPVSEAEVVDLAAAARVQ